LQVALTIITAIETEHVEALGGSLESIAAAKAGIVQAGGTVVVAEQGISSMAALNEALRTIKPRKIYYAPNHISVAAGALLQRHGTGNAGHLS
jgi:folylpolyglutamate synthase/dihydropteroate synthase